jgi:hypothetical protein
MVIVQMEIQVLIINDENVLLECQHLLMVLVIVDQILHGHVMVSIVDLQIVVIYQVSVLLYHEYVIIVLHDVVLLVLLLIHDWAILPVVEIL